MKFKITLEAPGFNREVLTDTQGLSAPEIVGLILAWLCMFDDEAKRFSVQLSRRNWFSDLVARRMWRKGKR